MSELTLRLNALMGFVPSESIPTDPRLEVRRSLRIIAHYEREIASDHMTLNVAADRAFGDLIGQNRAKDVDQRGMVR